MNKMFAFFTFCYLSMVFLSFAVEGETGFVATRLTSEVGLEDAIITVDSTVDFPATDFIIIDEEVICYTTSTTTQFGTSGTPVTRGCRNTQAAPHKITSVYNESGGALNQGLAYRINSLLTEGGGFKQLAGLVGLLGMLVPKLIMWDFAYLEGVLFGFPLGYIKFFIFYPLSIGFIIAIGFLIFSALRTAISTVAGR